MALPGTSTTAVVCDDDRLTRELVSHILEDRGVAVLAEADTALDAIDLVERFSPDIVIVDIGLAFSSGQEVIDHVRERSLPLHVVAFTAFASTVQASAHVAVVEKPDFESLGRAIDAAVAIRHAEGADRRRPQRDVAPPSLRDAAGLDDAAEFYRILAAAEPSDALVAFPSDDDDLPLVVRRTLRTQDRVIRRHDSLVVLLVGGGDAGAAALIARIGARYPRVAAQAAVALLSAHADGNDALTSVTAAVRPAV